MGYDMTIENPTEAEDVGLEVATALFYSAVKERDALDAPHDDPAWIALQERVTAASKAMGQTNTSYFRLNIWGMGRYREAMHTLGMLVLDNDHPSFPDLPDGVTWEDVEIVEYPDQHEGEIPKPEAVAHHKANEAVLAWHMEPALGIEIHKFGSNDDWLVTPAEIRAALAAYRRADLPQIETALASAGIKDASDWGRWIDYLTRAEQQGGFRVA